VTFAKDLWGRQPDAGRFFKTEQHTISNLHTLKQTMQRIRPVIELKTSIEHIHQPAAMKYLIILISGTYAAGVAAKSAASSLSNTRSIMLPLEQQIRRGSLPEPEVSVDPTNMALALRWTAEINRRLQEAERTPVRKALVLQRTAHRSAVPRGGADYTFRFRIRDASSERETLTVFHAKSPRKVKQSGNEQHLVGVERWGPDVESFLGHLQKALRLRSVDLIQAMIYLDRACSVETPRTSCEAATSLPFCTPRTLHRLTLASLLLAKQTNSPSLTLRQLYYSKLQSLGIPLRELQEMVDTMRVALGDPGLFVGRDQRKEWERTWRNKFPGSGRRHVDLEAPLEPQAVQKEDCLELSQAGTLPQRRRPVHV
jgi:hypothetical protein